MGCYFVKGCLCVCLNMFVDCDWTLFWATDGGSLSWIIMQLLVNLKLCLEPVLTNYAFGSEHEMMVVACLLL